MNPRLKTSKKWTAFPKEYLDQIRSVFLENFKAQLTGSNFHVEGRIYPEEIALRVGFGQKNQLAQNNFIVSMNYDKKTPQIVEKIHLCIDAVASIMTDHFENPETELPREWQEFEFNKDRIYFYYSTENADLEAQANALLGETESDLYNETSEDEDALSVAEVDRETDPKKH